MGSRTPEVPPPRPPPEASDELLSGDLQLASRALFLGHYTREELDAALAARGFWRDLAARGHPDAFVVFEEHATIGVRVLLRSGGDELGELRAHAGEFEGLRVVVIDWLEARDPRGRFTASRPQLPGQASPGLGLGRRLVDLLAAAARRTGAEGILAQPRHYHNAILYGRAGFHAWDPDVEGRILAVARDTASARLADVSWAFERGTLQDASVGAPVAWSALAGAMLLPTGRALESRFRDRAYRRAVRAASREARFVLA